MQYRRITQDISINNDRIIYGNDEFQSISQDSNYFRVHIQRLRAN